jgi:hypothetical protein
MNIEHYWCNDTHSGKTVVLGETSVPMPLFTPLIPRVLSWDRTRFSSFFIFIYLSFFLSIRAFYLFYWTSRGSSFLVCMRKLVGTSVLTGIRSHIHFYSSLSYFWFITTSFTILLLYVFSVWIFAELPLCSVILVPPIQQMCRYNSQFLSFYCQTLPISPYRQRNFIILWKKCHYVKSSSFGLEYRYYTPVNLISSPSVEV